MSASEDDGDHSSGTSDVLAATSSQHPYGVWGVFTFGLVAIQERDVADR
jgi:hypothetical protein